MNVHFIYFIINIEPQVDVDKGLEVFEQTEKDLRDMLNSADEGESQLAKGFDLGRFLESSGKYMTCPFDNIN